MTQRLSYQAVMLARTESFGRFMAKRVGVPYTDNPTSQVDAWVREACKVTSRSEFDSDPVAAFRFESLRREYRATLAAD